MSEYFLTTGAELDVAEILDYVSDDAIGAAMELQEDFLAAFARLAEFPHAGHVRADYAPPAVRFWVVRSYVVVYRADVTPIEILRVMSGYRDIAEQLTWGVSEAAGLALLVA